MDDLIASGFEILQKSVKHANKLPKAQLYEQYRSIPDFHTVKRIFNYNLVVQQNNVSGQPSLFNLGADNIKHNMEQIINENDRRLDNISDNFDAVNRMGHDIQGQVATSTNNINATMNETNEHQHTGESSSLAQSHTVIYSPAISATKLDLNIFPGPGIIFIEKPQNFFTNPIDNSNTLFIPSITEKSNYMKPLSLEFLYDNDGNHIGYKNPYEFELSVFKPLPQWVQNSTQLQAPISPKYTKLFYIDTLADFDETIKHLETVDEMAVDLEHNHQRSYLGLTCLIQITTVEGDFILDPFSLRDHIHRLNNVFTDPKKLKVLHGAGSDVLWLQRDFGVYIVGMFDTFVASNLLNLPKKSLQYLITRYCRVYVDKTQQLADWRRRPLTISMVNYARLDTHYLLYIYRRMISDMHMVSGGNLDLIYTAFNMSANVCNQYYIKPQVTETSYKVVLNMLPTEGVFCSVQSYVLKKLYEWRDTLARAYDESPEYVLPSNMMLSLADLLPTNVHGIIFQCQPLPPLLTPHLNELQELIQHSCNSPEAGICENLCVVPPEYDVHDIPANHINREEETIVEQQISTRNLVCYLVTNSISIRVAVMSEDADVLLAPILNKDNDTQLEFELVQHFLPPFIRYLECRLWEKEHNTQYNKKISQFSYRSRTYV